MSENKPRGRGRPRKEESEQVLDNKLNRAEESEERVRVPVTGQRDILGVKNKDPAFHYRWVKDDGATGFRVHAYTEGGYEFVKQDGRHIISGGSVYDAGEVGSLLTKPAGHGEHLFLMRIKREWYEEDLAAKAKRVNRSEGAFKQHNEYNGEYRPSLGAKLSRDT